MNKPSLTHIATEARRLLKQIKEPHRLELQEALAELCETHWQELRGPQPDTPLAQALWSVTPPWSDLLLDLYANGDARLIDMLPKSKLPKDPALLVLAEIERGNEQAVYLAYEPMMAFESTSPPANWLDRITLLLRCNLEPPVLHRHNSHDALWKALAVIASHTKRLDLPAALQVIALLTEPPAKSSDDKSLETLRLDVFEVGIHFLRIENDYVHFEQHNHAHKPVRIRQLGEMLLEIRGRWLD